jgi:hypothetical protein
VAEGAESYRPGRRREPSDSFRSLRSPGHCLDCTRCAAVTGNHLLDRAGLCVRKSSLTSRCRP